MNKNLLSLVKIGNLKIGLVKNGKPIATERILVTEPTKDNTENFTIMHGFNVEGEESVKITLPFDKPELNFEVNYVIFAKINDIEYMIKAEKIGAPLLAYPLNIEDFDKKVINMGKLSAALIKKYQLKRTGFLKAHLVGVSGYGEVVYFKTQSANSIRSIQDQLNALTALTKGNIAGLELEIRALKKDINEKEIVYVSVSYRGDIITGLGEYLEQRDNSKVSIAAFEKAYEASRKLAEKDIEDLKEMKDVKVEIDTSKESEIDELTDAANKENEKALSEEGEYVKELFEKNGIVKIPVPVGVNALKSFETKEEFEEFFSEERTLADVIAAIK